MKLTEKFEKLCERYKISGDAKKELLELMKYSYTSGISDCLKIWIEKKPTNLKT